MTKQQESPLIPSDIMVYVKIKEHFIPEKNIQSVSRFGKGCKVTLVSGEELVISLSYDTVVSVVRK